MITHHHHPTTTTTATAQGVYSGVVNNPSLSRYIRYNAMQAVLLDILLM